MRSAIIILCAILLAVTGCDSPGSTSSSIAIQQQLWLAPLAYLDGQPVRRDDIDDLLIEAAGGRILAEYILNQTVQRELLRQGLQLSARNIADEKMIYMKLLDDDPQIAARLMAEQRKRQGVKRFDAFIVRQAGLRLLVHDEVEMSDLAVRQAYEFQYGQRYEVRLIVVKTLQAASDVIRRANNGERFIELAIELSTDPSRAQGGLLSPMSLVDPTYPLTMRQTVEKLKPGSISSPIALEAGYAVVRLERIISAVDQEFEEVQEQLTEIVRRQSQQLLIQRKARTMLQEVDLQIHDPALRRGWELQLQSMVGQ